MNLENKKQIAIVALAIGFGLVAAVLTGNHIQDSIKKQTALLSQEYENKKIKPLMQEIQTLRDEMKKLATQQATVAQKVGDTKSEAPAAPKSTLALRTPAGKRAYTILIDSLSAVGGLINPGDYIDVIGDLNMPDPVTNKTENIITMLFQNVQILAVGTNLTGPGGYEQQQATRALNITFALSPEEAGLLTFIQKNGRLYLILRAPAETETQIMQVSNWSALADYVFEKQGTELIIPRQRALIEPVPGGGKDEVKPFIEIFRGGREM